MKRDRIDGERNGLKESRVNIRKSRGCRTEDTQNVFSEAQTTHLHKEKKTTTTHTYTYTGETKPSRSNPLG